jgi:hypothetical protein
VWLYLLSQRDEGRQLLVRQTSYYICYLFEIIVNAVAHKAFVFVYECYFFYFFFETNKAKQILPEGGNIQNEVIV